MKKLLGSLVVLAGLFLTPVMSMGAKAAEVDLLNPIMEEEVVPVETQEAVPAEETAEDITVNSVDMPTSEISAMPSSEEESSEEIPETEETAGENAVETKTEEAAPAATEEAVPAEEEALTTEEADAFSAENIENAEDATSEDALPTAPATEEAPADDSASEIVTGTLIGATSRSYAVMSDGSDAWCIEQDLNHCDENAQYTVDETADGSDFNSVFVAIAEADEAGLDETETRQVAQLAIWTILNPDQDLRTTVRVKYGNHLDTFDKMVSGSYEGEYNFDYKMYTPINTLANGAKYQRLISGKASKYVPIVEEEPLPPAPAEEEVEEVPDDSSDLVEEPSEPVSNDVVEETEESPVEEVLSYTEEPTTTVPAPTVTVRPAPQALSWTSIPQTGDDGLNIYVLFSIAIVAILGLVATRKRA